MVDVRYVAHLPRLLSRRDLRAHPLLSQMDVLRRGNRLSVQPVTPEQWQAVLAFGGLIDPLGES
jgi:predicted RNA-binding protein with PUA-like domain